MHISIQSFGRPKNVSRYIETLDPYKATWYVPESQVKDYEEEGATVFPVPDEEYPMKAYQLNAALDNGFKDNEYVVCMDDDIVDIKNMQGEKIKLSEFIDVTYKNLSNSRFHLSGYSGLTNTFWLTGKDVEYGDVWGGFSMHKPSALRYDLKAKILEDLDYCIQQYLAFGGVLLTRSYAVKFQAMGTHETSKKRQEGGYAGSEVRQLLQDDVITYFSEKYKDDPRIKFVLGCKVGDKPHEIKWKQMWRPENTLESFF